MNIRINHKEIDICVVEIVLIYLAPYVGIDGRWYSDGWILMGSTSLLSYPSTRVGSRRWLTVRS